MFFRYLMARSRPFSAATGALLAVLGGLAIYRMLQTGRLWGRYRNVEFETDPVVFVLFLALMMIFTFMMAWVTLLAIVPAAASPNVPNWLTDRARQLEEHRASDLGQMRTRYRELDGSDEPPVFVIPKQRGVQVSGIHMLDESEGAPRNMPREGSGEPSSFKEGRKS